MVRKKIQEPSEEVIEPVVVEEPYFAKATKGKWVWVAGGILAAVVYFWYRTGSWPVVAVVNGRPITRFEVDQALFRQQGQVVAEGLITRELIKQETRKLGIKVQESDISAQVEEIKKGLGEGVTLEQALAGRGMTMAELADQIELQLIVEKALADKTGVASDEAEKYIKDNEKLFPKEMTTQERLEQANAILKDQKTQEALTAWLDGLRRAAAVWRAFSSSETGTGQ